MVQKETARSSAPRSKAGLDGAGDPLVYLSAGPGKSTGRRFPIVGTVPFRSVTGHHVLAQGNQRAVLILNDLAAAVNGTFLREFHGAH